MVDPQDRRYSKFLSVPPRLLASGLTGELTQASRNDCDPGKAGAECLAVGALLFVCD